MLELEQGKDYSCEVGEALNHLGALMQPLQSGCGGVQRSLPHWVHISPTQLESAPWKGQSFSMTGLSDLHRSMYRKLVI